MSYIYEMHCHTGCTSRCGRVEPERIVELYREEGYSGIVATDHYSPLTFIPNWNPQKQIDFYLEGYRRMKAAAGDDFTVLLGMELRHYASGNDYLIYGVTEDFLYNAGNLMMKSVRQMRKFCDENGWLLYQAHPFRPYIVRAGVMKYLDGVEVYNGKCNDKENGKSFAWAKKNGKLIVSGSDFHTEKNLAKGGIITEAPIKSNDDLLSVLKSGQFTLVRN
ncbi:MAG: PHP domain-containing protein [Eubacterium sp.]|nr:PHP domain-containing protein [Eubacterium sp.]